MSDRNLELCFQCETGFYLLNNAQCVSTCPPGFYADDIFGWCVRCDCNCLTCTSKYTCTMCNGNMDFFEIINGTCYENPLQIPTIQISETWDSFNFIFTKSHGILYYADEITNGDEYDFWYHLCYNNRLKTNWNSYGIGYEQLDVIIERFIGN